MPRRGLLRLSEGMKWDECPRTKQKGSQLVQSPWGPGSHIPILLDGLRLTKPSGPGKDLQPGRLGKKIKIKQNKWKSSTRFSVNAAGWIWSEKFCFIQVSASMFLPWGIRSTLAPCLFDFFSLIYDIILRSHACYLFFSLYLLLDYNSMWTWSICFSLWKDIAWLREGTCKQLLNEWMKAP